MFTTTGTGDKDRTRLLVLRIVVPDRVRVALYVDLLERHTLVL